LHDFDVIASRNRMTIAYFGKNEWKLSSHGSQKRILLSSLRIPSNTLKIFTCSKVYFDRLIVLWR